MQTYQVVWGNMVLFVGLKKMFKEEKELSKGFDTTDDCTPHGQQILDAGYTWVGRYSSHSNWKNMTRAEGLHLSNMGIFLVNVWESAGDQVSFFTEGQGRQD